VRKEADVKRRIKEVLTQMGVWWVMYVPMGMGKAGVPDFLCCYNGRFIAIEAKFGNALPTALQTYQMAEIRKAKGDVLVITEKNVNELRQRIEHV